MADLSNPDAASELKPNQVVTPVERGIIAMCSDENRGTSEFVIKSSVKPCKVTSNPNLSPYTEVRPLPLSERHGSLEKALGGIKCFSFGMTKLSVVYVNYRLKVWTN